MTNVIINADDFGMEEEVNKAIVLLAERGLIQATSVMVNLPLSDEALQKAQSFKNVNLGLHFNLTEGVALSEPKDVSLLVRSDGRFKNGFLKLLILSFLRPFSFQKQVRTELENQYRKMAKYLHVTHIDSHRHIHMIPFIYREVKNLAREVQVPHVRQVNESLWCTLKSKGDWRFLTDGGLIKYMVLKFLYYFNRDKSNRYFYSILHTGHLFGKNVKSVCVPSKYDTVEIGIHPANTSLSTDKRFRELNTLLNREIKIRERKKS